ncbi:hypothetical protein Z043_108415 [Scleropages formosus]|uniref:Uncharacterized protein n=1 Tax=Scleropages formosus TaxID=113540 RepID=A0A0P7X6L4_SCLFO|nr:hypothetical protein Z043_108415 [Scleropages formosus]
MLPSRAQELFTYCYTADCSSIEEITRTFQCLEEQDTFHMEHGIENPKQKKCQQTWAQGRKVIGISGSESRCLQPCASISERGMSVSSCANYTLSAFCENNVSAARARSAQIPQVVKTTHVPRLLFQERNGYEILISFYGNAAKRAQSSGAPPAAQTVGWGSLCASAFITALIGASARW